MYFAKFPQILVNIDGKQKFITDFFTRVVVSEKYAKYHSLLMPYVVKEGERIEHVAYNFYKDSNYHWVIILVNGITNPYTDWPMSYDELYQYALEKYGSQANMHTVHHYELLNGVVIDETMLPELTADEYVSVTNWEYEQRLNDEKREIMILDPSNLVEFEMNLVKELNG